MSTNLLAHADRLSDDDLLARLDALAMREHSTTVEMVAHLASLESRPSAYAARGFGSLYAYCTQALHLSEDAACSRIEVAKICRRFPAVLGRLGSGAVTLTSVRMLGRHLTPENHLAVLERARGRTCDEMKILIAELAPRPDVQTSVRRAPTITLPPATTAGADPAQEGTLFSNLPAHPDAAVNPSNAAPAAPTSPRDQATPMGARHRSTIEATAPNRYCVRFMMDDEMHARLRRVQTLLRREIPGGDAREIFDRALKLLEADVERQKLGRGVKPRAKGPIRRETDNRRAKPSRHIPNEVKDSVERRDGGQCAFVAPDGRRCTERSFLEFHHRQPYANGGEATLDNIALRCRRHNQYEAELVFGAHRVARRWDHSQMTHDSIRTPPPAKPRAASPTRPARP